MEIKNFRAIHKKEYIYELIEEGEHEQQDFKFAISDSRKIARSIAAFANNRGGRLLVGVKDNGNVAGIRNEEEFYMIEQAASMYCKPSQKVKQTMYCVDGRYVLVVEIDAVECRPVLAQDDNRQWQPYYRVADENIQVPPLMVKVWKTRKRKGVLVSFSESESKMLDFVAENQPVLPEDIERAALISKKTAEATIVKMCSLGVWKMFFYNKAWRIAVLDGYCG